MGSGQGECAPPGAQTSRSGYARITCASNAENNFLKKMSKPALLARRYTKEHEWVDAIDDGAIIVGITEFAQDQLGDVVSVELPEAGVSYRKNDAIAIIDSVKTSTDVYSPVDGRITHVNESLLSQPELINKSPYQDGWIVKMVPENRAQLDSMLTQDQYDELVGNAEK